MKKYLPLFLAVVMSASLMAIPAYRGAIKAQQPDGTTIEIFQHGDEHFHYLTNANGEWLVKNSDGYYVVTEALTPQQINERRMASPMLKSQIQRAKRRTPINLNISQYGLIILVNFNDVAFQCENTRQAMDEMHNGDNYTYNGATGSVRMYFYDQSMGKYNPTFDVIGPVALSNPMAYYGGNDSNGFDKNAEAMIAEACRLADQQFDVDFTKYDNDGDGKVDFVYVIYAGQGEADSDDENTVWPHQWSLSSAGITCTLDGKEINNYACGSELNSDERRCGIGTFCHEFSHVCGLPDLYSTDASNYTHKTMGSWDILDYGPYNNDGNTPPSYSAYERFFCGWLTPTYINENANISFQDLQISNKAFIITTNGEPNLVGNDPNPTTFWLLENRQQTGWDTYLPGHGLMITKVTYSYDKWTDNTVNNKPSAMGVDIIEADGQAPSSNHGKAKDLFPAGATKYSGISGHAITDIVETDGVVSFKLMDGLSTSFHELSVFSNNADAGSVFGSGLYYENNEVVLLATANRGYQFKQWADGVTDNPRWVMPADTFMIAEFEEAPIEEDTVIVEPEKVTVRFYADWDVVNAYTWGCDDFGEWPGKPIERGDDGWYFAVIKAGANILFNDGMLQTEDILNVTRDVCYELGELRYSEKIYTVVENTDCQFAEPEPEPKPDSVTVRFYADWDSVNVYTWSSNGDSPYLWPGKPIERGDDGWYSVEIEAGTNVIFNDGMLQTVDILSVVKDVCYELGELYYSEKIYTVVENTDCQLILEPQPSFKLTLNVNDTTMGWVYGGGVYTNDTTVTITAEPGDLFVFDYWTNGTDKFYDKKITINLTQDTAFTAHFSPWLVDVSYTVQGSYLSYDIYNIPVIRSGNDKFTIYLTDDLKREILAGLERSFDSYCYEFRYNYNLGGYYLDIPEDLLEQEFDIDFKNERGYFPLTDTLYNGRLDVDLPANDRFISVYAGASDGTMGSVSASSDYLSCDNTSVDVYAEPKDGYQFVEWTDSYGNTFTANPYTLNYYDYPDYDYIDIEAQFEPIVVEQDTFTVTFLAADGQLLDRQTVTKDSAAIAPQAPEIEGYTFVGWNTDFSNVRSDLVVTAQYERIYLTVQFYGFNGELLGEQQVAYGDSAVALVAPEIEGYRFIGWNTDFSSVKSETIVTAQYERIYLTVQFYGFNGELLGEQQVAYGDSAVALVAPEIEGYRFIGWNTDFSNVKSETIVTAQYERIYFNVQFIGFEGVLIDSQQVAYGDSAVKPEVPEVDGYYFTGWDADFHNVYSNLIINAQYQLCLLDSGTIQDGQNDLYWQLNCKNTLDISGSGDYVVDENNDIIDETVDINLNPGTALIVDGEVEQEVNTITQHIDMTSAASIIACEDRFLGSVLKVKFTIQTNVWYFLYFPFDVPFAQIQSPGQYVVYEYDGQIRATQGYGGWVRTHDKVESHKGYIYQASTAGELIITVPVPLFSCSTIEKVLPVHSADYIFDANWILAGNPYPSYFDMNTLLDAGFNAPIYVRNKNADDYIPVRPQDDDYHFHPYEAFFVQNPDKVMETIMNWYSNGRETESQIRNQHGRYMRREAVRRTRQSEQQRYFVEFNLTDGSNDDHTRVVFNETATADYDLGTDAIKMEGSAPVRIFTLDEQVQYAINERPLTEQPIHVGYTVTNSGVYTLSAMRWDSDVELYDNELDQKVDFTNGDYMFYTTAGTNTTRFSLIGKNNVPTDIDNIDEADGRVSVFSITGALIYDNVMLNDVKLQSGVYLIKSAREVKKVVIK